MRKVETITIKTCSCCGRKLTWSDVRFVAYWEIEDKKLPLFNCVHCHSTLVIQAVQPVKKAS